MTDVVHRCVNCGAFVHDDESYCADCWPIEEHFTCQRIRFSEKDIRAAWLTVITVAAVLVIVGIIWLVKQI